MQQLLEPKRVKVSPIPEVGRAEAWLQTDAGNLSFISPWLRGFSGEEIDGIKAAFETGSIAKARRALRQLKANAEARRSFKVEILSTFNLEPFLPILELAFECLPSNASVGLAPLDSIEASLASAGTGTLDARIILWRIEEIMPEAFFPFTYGFEILEARLGVANDRFRRIVEMHQQAAPGVPLFLSTLPLPDHFSNPSSAAQHRSGLPAAVARLNCKLYECADSSRGVHVLDISSWAAHEGNSSFDQTLDFMARQPLTAKGQVSFALLLARSLRPLLVPRRKVIAIDLDNTIWGGVVGEDGIARLKLGHEFPGNIHLRIQRELLELKKRGVLLAIVSKNNEADAREAFESLPDMLLKWDDFVLRKIDWNHKHENLRAAASELSLGLDSFVLIDDSNYEREQVRQLMPEVLVLNESADPLHILRALLQTDAFDSLGHTEEDNSRHQDYAIRDARNASLHTNDLEAFLRSLEMRTSFEEIGEKNFERVWSMLGKTNQFNLTNRRHSRAELQALIDKPRAIALALRLADKFGEQGIVAMLLAVPGPDNDTLTVDSFLVSCRALGRGVEDALWAEMLERAAEQGTRRIEAKFIVTAKNGIVANLYERLGLEQVLKDDTRVTYRLDPITPPSFPAWISRHST